MFQNLNNATFYLIFVVFVKTKAGKLKKIVTLKVLA